MGSTSANNEVAPFFPLRHPPSSYSCPVYLRESSLALGQNWRGNKIGSATRVRGKVTNGSCIVKSIRVRRDAAKIGGNIANWSLQMRKRTESRRAELSRGGMNIIKISPEACRRNTAVTYFGDFITKVFSELSSNLAQITCQRKCRGTEILILDDFIMNLFLQKFIYFYFYGNIFYYYENKDSCWKKSSWKKRVINSSLENLILNRSMDSHEFKEKLRRIRNTPYSTSITIIELKSYFVFGIEEESPRF